MAQLGPFDPLTGGWFYLLSAGLLIFLCLALPVLTIVAIRFFWYRHIYVGHSRAFDELLVELRKISSAMSRFERELDDLPADKVDGYKRKVFGSMFDR